MADAPLPSESAAEQGVTFAELLNELTAQLGMGTMVTLTKILDDQADGKYNDEGPEFNRGMEAVLGPVRKNVAEIIERLLV